MSEKKRFCRKCSKFMEENQNKCHLCGCEDIMIYRGGVCVNEQDVIGVDVSGCVSRKLTDEEKASLDNSEQPQQVEVEPIGYLVKWFEYHDEHIAEPMENIFPTEESAKQALGNSLTSCEPLILKADSESTITQLKQQIEDLEKDISIRKKQHKNMVDIKRRTSAKLGDKYKECSQLTADKARLVKDYKRVFDAISCDNNCLSKKVYADCDCYYGTLKESMLEFIESQAIKETE